MTQLLYVGLRKYDSQIFLQGKIWPSFHSEWPDIFNCDLGFLYKIRTGLDLSPEEMLEENGFSDTIKQVGSLWKKNNATIKKFRSEIKRLGQSE